MWYVYDRRSTAIVKSYKTRGAAHAAITRAGRRFQDLAAAHPDTVTAEMNPLTWQAAADSEFFHNFIEQRVTRKNLMTGEEFTQPVNTPRSCDPSSEAFWSM